MPVLAVLVTALAVTASGTAALTGPGLYPDIKTLPPRDIRFDRTDVSYNLTGLPQDIHNVLRFSNTTYNVGEGPLELSATVDPVTKDGTAYQRIFAANGSFTDLDAGRVYYHAAHDHWHYDGWGDYELWTKANYDAWVASGRNPSLATFIPGVKSTACVEDEEFIVNVPGTLYPHTYGSGGCYPDGNGFLREGLATGWGDTYDYYRPAQWFDLGQSGTLANGQYVIRSIADPNNQLDESPGGTDPAREGDASNEATTSFTISGGLVADTDPPTGTVAINDVDASTASSNVTVKVIGRDDVSGVNQFRVSNNGTNWSTLPYTTTGSFATAISWDLANPVYGGTATAGVKTVSVQFHDVSGKWGPTMTDTINLTQPAQGSPYAQAIVAEQPVGYWRLDELSGSTALDASSGGHNGTYIGGPTLGASGLLATEPADKGVSFGAAGKYLSVPSATSISTFTSMSLEAWIKPTSIPTAGNFMSVMSKPESYSLQFNGPRLEFTVIQSGVRRRLQAPVGAIVAGNTYHVVGTYDGTTQRLYINGAQSVSAALTGAPTANTLALTIGSWGNSEIFQGTLDETVVYNRALTSGQVSAHYQAGTGGGAGTPLAPSNLLATAQFNTIINLGWTDNATNETGYVVEKDTTNAFANPVVTTLAANTTSYSSTGLTAGTTYYYRVKAMNGATASAYSNIAFATTTGGTGPAAPSSLVGTAQSSSAVGLTWVDNAADESGYTLDRDTSSSFSAPVSTSLPVNTTSAVSSGLAASTTYYFRVRATNAAGSSLNSNTASATTLPSSAAGYATTVLGDSPTAYWRLGDATTTTTARDQVGANPGANPGTYLNGVVHGSPSLLPASTADTAATFDGVNDYVRVANSAALNPSAAITLEAWIKPTSIPTAGSFRGIVTKPESYALQFNGPQLEFTVIQGGVRRRLQAPVGTIVAGQTYFVAGTYNGTTQRLYVNFAQVASQPLTGAIGPQTQVLSIGSWAASEYFSGSIDEVAVYSTALSAARLSAHYDAGRGASSGTAPAAPSSLTATAASSTSVSLLWVDNATDETGFTLERDTTAAFTAPTAISLGANVTSYSDTGRTPATQYFYRVRATNSAGNSPNSASATATTPAASGPAAPTGLVASTQSSSSIGLTWTDNAAGETSYVVERDLTAAFTAPVAATLAANASSYTDVLLMPSTTYFYRVKAVTSGVSSSYSNTSSSTTSGAGGTPPSAPSNVVATAQSSVAINLSWTDTSTTETGFLLERDVSINFPSPTVSSLGANTTTFADSGLTPATTYFYRVRATNASGPSGYSNVGQATTSSVPLSAYQTAVVADAPAGYWRLGEATGTTASDVQAANNGTYTNGPTLAAASLLGQDAANTAAQFDGSNDYVSVANSGSLSPSSTVSVEAWIKPQAIPGAGAFASIVTKREAYSLQMNGPQLEFTIIQNGTRRRLQAVAGAIQAGTVYHVVGTYDGTTQRLYINGVEVTNAPLTGAIGPTTNGVTIGSWSTSEYFSGVIDDAAIYGGALSAARVAAHYAAGH